MFVMFIASTGFTPGEKVAYASDKVSCPAPVMIALYRNGAGRPIPPGDPVSPNTTYLIKLSTYTPGYACITASSGLTFSGTGCEDVTPDGNFNNFKTITTNSSIPSGVSITISSFCSGSLGGSAVFNLPSN
jgi:hypothetical protein